MIKSVLIDLDNTLIEAENESLFTQSMKLIGARVGGRIPPDDFVTQALAAMQTSRANLDPTTTVGEAFYRNLHQRLGCPPNSLVSVFQQFYESGLADLRAAHFHLWPASRLAYFVASTPPAASSAAGGFLSSSWP